MPLNRDFIGRSMPPGRPYEISREKIREFAEAIGDTNPAHTDVEAARALGHPDVIAPPTFVTTVELHAGGGAITEGGLGLNYAMVVHGEQRYVHARPIRAGDVLVSHTTIADIRDAGRNELLTLVSEYRNGEELVCTGYNTIVSRGTAAPTA